MYKDTLKDEMLGLIADFFKVERGNRVTSFNIDGLLAKAQVILEKHLVPIKDPLEGMKPEKKDG